MNSFELTGFNHSNISNPNSLANILMTAVLPAPDGPVRTRIRCGLRWKGSAGSREVVNHALTSAIFFLCTAVSDSVVGWCLSIQRRVSVGVEGEVDVVVDVCCGSGTANESADGIFHTNFLLLGLRLVVDDDLDNDCFGSWAISSIASSIGGSSFVKSKTGAFFDVVGFGAFDCTTIISQSRSPSSLSSSSSES